MPAVGFNAKRLKADIFGIWHNPDGNDAVAEIMLSRFAILGFDRRRNASGGSGEPIDPCPGHDRHTLFGERLFEEGGNVSVLNRHDAVKHFDDGDIRAHIIVETGEFDPYRAGANDEQLCRHFRRYHGVAVCPDAFPVSRRERQIARAGTRGDDDVFGGQLFHFAIFGDGQFSGRGDCAITHMDGDSILFHQMANALIKLLRHPARTFDDSIDIGSDVIRCEAVILGMLHIMKDLSRAQEGLGRDAPPVEANATEVLALNDRDLETKLGSADRGDIATGART